MSTCSVCSNKATKEIQCFWYGKEKWIPRCDKHTIIGYEGKVREIQEKQHA